MVALYCDQQSRCLLIINDIHDFRLQYDEPLGLLRLAWVSGSSLRTMRSSAGQLLALAQRLRVRQLLLDMNTVPLIGAADEEWLGTEWMPGILQLPLERLILVIAQEEHLHNQMVVDALHDLVQPLIRFSSHYFSDPETAVDWLSDHSPRLPALLAEWDGVAASAAGPE